ncbi:hypothetical protein ABFS82_14G071700 [Erythranthe guttata]
MEIETAFFSRTRPENLGLYLVDLVMVFILSMIVEWLSHTARFLSISSNTNNVRVGLLQTGLYGVRMAMAYLVMLSVMSFNAGILFAAVAGYTVGFLIFGRIIF